MNPSSIEQNPTIYCVHPHPLEIEGNRRKRAWETFHKDILKRGKSLDILINFCKTVFDYVNTGEFKSFLIEEKHRHINPIFYPEIIEEGLYSHFLDYIYEETRNVGMLEKSFVGDKFVYNLICNTFRTLESYKENIQFTLPINDLKETSRLVKKLKSPPITDYFR